MQLATVIGDVVVTRKDDNSHGRTLPILQPIGATDSRSGGRSSPWTRWVPGWARRCSSSAERKRAFVSPR